MAVSGLSAYGCRSLQLRSFSLAWVSIFVAASVGAPILQSVQGWQDDVERMADARQLSQHNAYAVTTYWGPAHLALDNEMADRITKVGSVTRALVEQQITTVFFPEDILGTYTPAYDFALAREVGATATKARAVVGLGMSVPSASEERLSDSAEVRQWNNAVTIFTSGQVQEVSARLPIPGASWRPWSSHHYPMSLDRDTRIGMADGTKATVVFCYEEYIPMLWVWSTIRYPAPVAITVANLWWAVTRDSSRVQALHGISYARLFGIELIRSVNFPVKPKKG
jgi:hypothetical protein